MSGRARKRVCWLGFFVEGNRNEENLKVIVRERGIRWREEDE